MSPLRPAAALLAFSAAALLSSCALVPAPLRLDHAQRLLDRPDFPAAAQAAPEWCRDALKTINHLEAQLERK